MVVWRQIERLPGPRLSVEAEADADANTNTETRAGRRPAIISETIAGACSSPAGDDVVEDDVVGDDVVGDDDAGYDDATQTGRVQHREGVRSQAFRRAGETAPTTTSSDEASQSG